MTRKNIEATTHDVSILPGGQTLHHSTCWCRKDWIKRALIDYGLEHGWSKAYIEKAAPEIAERVMEAIK